MIIDQCNHRPHIQELGLRRVMKARVAKPSGKIRKYKVPANINFDAVAVKYFELIKWEDLLITSHLY